MLSGLTNDMRRYFLLAQKSLNAMAKSKLCSGTFPAFSCSRCWYFGDEKWSQYHILPDMERIFSVWYTLRLSLVMIGPTREPLTKLLPSMPTGNPRVVRSDKDVYCPDCGIHFLPQPIKSMAIHQNELPFVEEENAVGAGRKPSISSSWYRWIDAQSMFSNHGLFWGE